MKPIYVIIIWFTAITTLALLASCKSTSHCDAYGQVEAQKKELSK